jgi:acetylornithine deacetylase/succinyl-diaminopimelate desuccinylase-like protein
VPRGASNAAGFAAAPLGVAFDTADQMHQNAEKIYKQVVQTKAMPLANLTNMTDAERAQIAAWYESGANEGTEMSKEKLAQWIDAHFDEEVGVLQQLLRVPTDTPPATMRRMRTWWPIWSRPTAGRREARGAEQTVRDYGMESITNLIVRRPYAAGGPTVALNAHGDVVPPGDNWTYPPYGGVVDNGFIYGALRRCPSATSPPTSSRRALEALGVPLKGGLELHFTYDEEFGGLLGPGWLLEQKLTKPDYVIAAGFSYNIVTAHNACLQLEITVHGKSGHGAMPETGHDALQAATAS